MRGCQGETEGGSGESDFRVTDGIFAGNNAKKRDGICWAFYAACFLQRQRRCVPKPRVAAYSPQPWENLRGIPDNSKGVASGPGMQRRNVIRDATPLELKGFGVR